MRRYGTTMLAGEWQKTEILMNKMSPENIVLNFLLSKRWQPIRHILMLVFLAAIFYPNINETTFRKLNIKEADSIIRGLNNGTIVIYILSVLLIYVNLFFIVPNLLLKKKYIYYFTSYLVIAVLYFLGEYATSAYFLKGLSEYITLVEFSLKGFIDSTFIPLIFLFATAGYKIFKKWIIDTKLLAEMKEAKIQEELTNLKNQINPHFLFNTLNNLNTLISTDPVKASTVVLGLSDVLRYQLYEASADKVLLKKDIGILTQYLELEKIRRDNFQFSITVHNTIEGIVISPFIFINFVENAIKHSVDNKNFSYIALDFSRAGDHLLFSCKNSKPILTVKKTTGGLGLQNSKRRLELMYPENFTLTITDEVKEFIVHLKVPI